jgi:hypothetical protein
MPPNDTQCSGHHDEDDPDDDSEWCKSCKHLQKHIMMQAAADSAG